MQNTYLFYDIETSGLNKCFDQVLQFAAIRTDLALKEIERHEIFIKLNSDIIPSPAAVLVHKLTLNQMQNGVCEYEAIKEIHRLFNIPGTISVGYNSLGFDDEFLRFSFYRNLLTPYTHQYANNCGRMDIYPMTVMYYLFKPEVITWPKINDTVSLKLEHLNSENKLAVGISHDAMNDVETTISLARLLKKEQSMWEYLCGCFDKKTDLARTEKLTFTDKYQLTLLIDGGFGGVKFYQTPAIGLGSHNHYKNQSLWLSLEKNISTTKTFIERKRFGEPPLLLPLTERFSRYLNKEQTDIMTINLDWLQKNSALFSEIVEYHKEYKYPEIPDLDVDAALYQVGFVNDWERSICNRFHTVTLLDKLCISDDFTSPYLRDQAIRIIGRNYPAVLKERQSAYMEFTSYLKKIKNGEIIVNYKKESRLTPQAALAEIESLRQSQNLNILQNKLLDDLSKYIQCW